MKSVEAMPQKKGAGKEVNKEKGKKGKGHRIFFEREKENRSKFVSMSRRKECKVRVWKKNRGEREKMGGRSRRQPREKKLLLKGKQSAEKE